MKSTRLEDGRVRRSRSNNAALLASARDVFRECGYHAATVSAIAARAGVAHGTFYSHFKGKDDILIHLLDELTAAFDVTMEAPTAHSVAENRRIVQDQVERFLCLATAWQTTLRVYREAMAVSPTVAAHWEMVIGRVEARTVADIRRHRRLGWSKPLEPRIVGRGLVHMVLRFFWELVLGREQPSAIPLIAHTLTAIYFDGLYLPGIPPVGQA